MDKNAYCARAYIVGMALPLARGAVSGRAVPEDRVEGCSNLACSRCGAVVKSWPGSYWRKPIPSTWPRTPTPDERALIAEAHASVPVAYDAADAGPFLAPSPWTRAYACRCTNASTQTSAELGPLGDLVEHWSCAGHEAGP